MTKVGVLLAGCGVQDGSEIYEAVLTLLALDKAGADIRALAADVDQAVIVNHYTGEETRATESRTVLAEAARIVRGKIVSVNEVSAHDLDALIIPGGFGVVRNLCTYEAHGVEATVDPGTARLITELNGLGKPIGAICIAPMLVALSLRERKTGTPPIFTVGNDAKVALHLNQMGMHHHETTVDEICVDPANKIVSTAAFMLANGPAEAETGITKLVHQVLGLARENRPDYHGAPPVSQSLAS